MTSEICLLPIFIPSIWPSFGMESFSGGALLRFRSHVNSYIYHRRDPEFLMKLTRDNVQLLYSKLFDLPTEKVEETTLSKLPAPTTPLPRGKPVRYSALVDTFPNGSRNLRSRRRRSRRNGRSLQTLAGSKRRLSVSAWYGTSPQASGGHAGAMIVQTIMRSNGFSLRRLAKVVTCKGDVG